MTTPGPLAEELLERAYNYELGMLMETYATLRAGEQNNRVLDNALIESFCIHARALLRMRQLLVGTVLALSLSVAVSAPVAAFNLLGMGGSSCGEWTAARRYPGSSQAALNQQWILGFISGSADYDLDQNFDPLKGMDADGVSAWIDNYCAANPLKQQIDAAEAFVRARKSE